MPCYAGKANLVLTEYGELFPCESFSNSLGNVRDYDCNIKATLKSEQARIALEWLAQANCFCSHECYFITNIMLNPSMYPRMLKEYVKLQVA